MKKGRYLERKESRGVEDWREGEFSSLLERSTNRVESRMGKCIVYIGLTRRVLWASNTLKFEAEMSILVSMNMNLIIRVGVITVRPGASGRRSQGQGAANFGGGKIKLRTFFCRGAANVSFAWSGKTAGAGPEKGKCLFTRFNPGMENKDVWGLIVC